MQYEQRMLGGKLVRISPRTNRPVRAYHRKHPLMAVKAVKPKAARRAAEKAAAKPARRPYTRRAKATTTTAVQPQVDRVAQLAQAVWLSQINATGVVVQGDDVRHIVRQARVFWDEVDVPTEPKPVKSDNGTAARSSGPTVEEADLDESWA